MGIKLYIKPTLIFINDIVSAMAKIIDILFEIHDFIYGVKIIVLVKLFD